MLTTAEKPSIPCQPISILTLNSHKVWILVGFYMMDQSKLNHKCEVEGNRHNLQMNI